MDIEQIEHEEQYINISYTYLTLTPIEGVKYTNVFTPSNLCYSLYIAFNTKSDSNNKPEDMGLINTDHVKLRKPANNNTKKNLQH